MGLEGKGPQKSRQLELPQESRGETPRVERSEEAPTATYEDERSGTSGLMELVCERRNLQAALKRVRKNKGSAGIDGMTVEELPEHLRAHWSELREHLLSGAYRPSMVKERQIPKGNGEMRKLGIPTVLDRFIQQALLQVLQPIYDPSFSEHSYGFRPKRRAHDAVVQAQRHVQEGRGIVVDVDTLRTARCGPACRVVWEGPSGITWHPYPDCSREPGTLRWHSGSATRSGVGLAS